MSAASEIKESLATEVTDLPPHLSSDRHIHVIVSILSGAQEAQAYYDTTLSPVLARHHIQHTTHVTESTQTIINLTRYTFLPQAREGKPQTIILLSGDGGLIDIVNTLACNLDNELLDQGQKSKSTYVKPAICIFPQGTANALAWSSQIAADPISAMLQGHATPLPIFRATFSPGARLVVNEGTQLEPITTTNLDDATSITQQIYGAVVFSWGLHASLVSRSDTREYRKHGRERFPMAAAELMKQNHAYNGTVSIKSGTDHATAWHPIDSSPTSTTTTATSNSSSNLSYLAATLVSNLEQTYTISPAQRPLSQDMHVVYIVHVPASELGEIAFLPYKQGQHVHDPRVTYKAIDGLRIQVNEPDELWREICVDGKIVRLEQDGWAQVEKLTGASVVDVVAVAGGTESG